MKKKIVIVLLGFITVLLIVWKIDRCKPPSLAQAMHTFTQLTQSTKDYDILKKLIENYFHYAQLKAKQSSVGSAMPEQEKQFLQTGYEQNKQQLLNQLEQQSSQTIRKQATRIVKATRKKAEFIGKQSPTFVGEIKPEVKNFLVNLAQEIEALGLQQVTKITP